MKKALIITYYWPPSGGGGVQRWLKFTKYMPGFDWQPIVYTPENPEFPVPDESLLKDIHNNVKVIKIPIWEPYQIYKKFTGQGKETTIQTGFLSDKKKDSWKEKFSVWIRGNFFIPDARIFWVRPSVQFLSQYLKTQAVDVIITTGPPHSMHLIGMKLKKKLNIPWIADFRDPWTNVDYYGDLMVSKPADLIHRKLERKVLKSADALITVSYNWAQDFINTGASVVKVITNGYDASDFINLSDNVRKDKKFSLSHIGYMNKDRNPIFLWKAIKELCEEIPGFKEDILLKFIGKTDYNVFDSLKSYGIYFAVEKIDYLPHVEVLVEYKKSRVLLLILNQTPDAQGRVPGKIFEYLVSESPVLSVGPVEGDSAKIIKETNAGFAVDFNDKSKMKDYIMQLYDAYKSGKQLFKTKGIEKYERKNLTNDLIDFLEEITAKKN